PASRPAVRSAVRPAVRAAVEAGRTGSLCPHQPLTAILRYRSVTVAVIQDPSVAVPPKLGINPRTVSPRAARPPPDTLRSLHESDRPEVRRVIRRRCRRDPARGPTRGRDPAGRSPGG